MPTGQHPYSELDARGSALRAAAKLVILEDLHVGRKGRQTDTVRMDCDQFMGALYPFRLRDSLSRSTETRPGTTPPHRRWGCSPISRSVCWMGPAGRFVQHNESR